MSERKIFVGTDWFTATSRDDRVGMAWSVMVNNRKHTVERPLHDITEWRNRWYSGIKVKGLAWGYSPANGYILIAQGAVAMEYWRKCLPMAGRVTRVDVQVTVLLPEPEIGLVSAYYAGVKSRKDRQYSIIQNSRDGQTLYVGSRHSDHFGRVYDKGVKSGEYKPGALWRYEVQVQKPRADALVVSMLRKDKQGDDLDVPIKSYVWNWFNKRGVEPQFSPADNALVAEVGKTLTTTDKKLNWLRTQVRPSLQRLIDDGLGREAIAALGLDNPAVQGELLEQLPGGDEHPLAKS